MSPNPIQPQTFALTTPLYYVNALPHIGSAYTTVAADVVARFYRLMGYSVSFVTGTDEHGQKIQRTAQEKGRDPQEYCDEIVACFEDLWQKLNIRYDCLSRTAAPRHEAIVREFFQRVWDNGDIYLGQQKGWYCVACEEFKDEGELLEDHHCPLHPNRQVEWRDEENYFFRLSKYQAALEELYQRQPDFIQPPMRRNEVLSFVQGGLKDFSISRINMDWGFAFPGHPDHTLYVWFDALLGYITGLLDPEDEPTLAQVMQRGYPFDLHLIGKDILRFHAVYWPAMLLSAGMPLPRRVFGHGFLTKDGHKISKTLGNTVDPVDLVERFGSDAFRYYFMKEIEFGRDGDYNETRFINTVNADLANDLGNLLNRTLGMARKYCGGTVPDLDVTAIAPENPLKALGDPLTAQVRQAYESLAFHQACNASLSLVRAGNKYIDDRAPWSLYKQGEQAAVEEVLYSVLESVRLVAYLLSPVVPQLSTAIYGQLGYLIDFDQMESTQETAPFERHGRWGVLPPGQALSKPEPVFRRIEVPRE